MTLISISSPPVYSAPIKYNNYKGWLLENFYFHLCSYCLLNFTENLEIDHYEPKEYAPEKYHNPDNLLLACPKCNKSKSDYHPLHNSRKRLKKFLFGHYVINIRKDNFAELIFLNEKGELVPRDGINKSRVEFNITLLKVNSKGYIKERRSALEKKNLCEALLEIPGSEIIHLSEQIQILLDYCAERYLFYKAFDVPLTEKLRARILRLLSP